MGTNAWSVVPPRLGPPLPSTKNPAGDATGWEEPASLSASGPPGPLACRVTAAGPARANGVQAGACPFARRLRGPFSSGVQVGISPAPALWAAVLEPTRPLRSLCALKLLRLYAQPAKCQGLPARCRQASTRFPFTFLPPTDVGDGEGRHIGCDRFHAPTQQALQVC